MTDPNPETAAPYCWQGILPMMLDRRSRLAGANLIAILGALLAVPVPLLIPMLVDEVLLERPGILLASLNTFFPPAWQTPSLYILAILIVTVLLRFGNFLLGVWHTRLFAGISKEVTFRIRRDLLARLKRVAISEYETLGSGTIASHLVTDVDTIDEFLGIATSKLLVAILSILGTAAVLVWMHWQLALFILLLNPVVIYLTVMFGHRVKRLRRQQNSAYQAFQEVLAETLDAVHELRAANREQHYVERIVSSADTIRRCSISHAWQSDAANRLSFLVFLIGFDIFRAASMLLVLFSDLSIGEMLAFYAYLWFMMGPVQEVLGVQYAWNSANAALARLNHLFRLRLEPVHPSRRDPFQGRKTLGIALEDVSFSYGGRFRVLDGVNLRIAAGEKAALVGSSGEGKTTLIHLLLGFYEPDRGTIRYGQDSIGEIGLELVRSHVAVVLQHPALFNDTVRNNLSLGRELNEATLMQALEIAQLKAFVEGLPQGLDTPIGRDGIRFSGGQRQRLAIARMILSDPKIVILDEATSALDAATEEQLHASLRQFLDGRTVLIVAHRLSAVRQAQRILVFKDGRIAEEGSHEELIAADGVYAGLYAPQL